MAIAYAGQASAIANGPESGREVINPQRSFGDMPLVVLTSGQRPMPPGGSRRGTLTGGGVFPNSSIRT